MSAALHTHAPVALVLLPMVAAMVGVLVQSRRLARALTVGVAVAMFAVALWLLWLLNVTYPGQEFRYLLGGWAAPWGIEYRIDALTAFVLTTINGVHLGAAIFCLRRTDAHLSDFGRVAFYAAWLLCMTGLNGMVITNDAFNVFVFLEISSLAAYTLISCGRDPRALVAAYRYLIAGAIGATFILLAIGLLYMHTGTLNISDLATRIAARGTNHTLLLAVAFFIIGIGIKCALFPLHNWLPNAYCFAPDSVTVLLSGTATKVALYVLLRFLYHLFGADYALTAMPLNLLLIGCAGFGMLIAPLIALRESNLKRMFAWSSVAQISYIVMGLGIGSTAGVTAALLHIFNHSLIKAAVFMAVAILISRTGTAQITELGGAARHHRFACYTLLIGGLGLIGIPGTVGFVSKWVLVSAVVAHGWWWLVLPVLVGSLASAAYVWRIVETLWLSPGTSPATQAPPRSRAASPYWVEWLPLSFLTTLAVLFGLYATPIIVLAERAAHALTGSGS